MKAKNDSVLIGQQNPRTICECNRTTVISNVHSVHVWRIIETGKTWSMNAIKTVKISNCWIEMKCKTTKFNSYIFIEKIRLSCWNNWIIGPIKFFVKSNIFQFANFENVILWRALICLFTLKHFCFNNFQAWIDFFSQISCKLNLIWCNGFYLPVNFRWLKPT